MSNITVDPNLIKEIKKYGAFDVSACFNCGTCTAICPLTDEEGNFPRRIIRYAQLGQKEKLEGSKELWLCYYCGECSDTCPREANPGEFMMSARRYAIASYDPTGISKFLYKSKLFSGFMAALVAFLVGLAFYIVRGNEVHTDSLLFEIDPAYIHWGGYALMAFLAIVVVAELWKMTTRIYNKEKEKLEKEGVEIDEKIFPKLVRWVKNAFNILFVEFIAQKRYFRREKVEEEKWIFSKWFIHLNIVLGFSGLFVATALDFFLDIINVKKTPIGAVPLFYPTRLLGTIAGLMLLYGIILAFFFRLKKQDSSREHSRFSDWFLLFLLFGLAVSGFILEILVYFSLDNEQFAFWTFIVHVVFAVEMIIFAPFSKLAHLMYRTYALWIYKNLQTAPKKYPEIADLIIYEE